MIDPSPEQLIAAKLESLADYCGEAGWISTPHGLIPDVLREAAALLRLPRVPLAEEIIVDAYQKAQDLWSSQCFCFTSAPESLRRTAHEVARDGFNEIVTLLGPIARPVLDAEYREAAALAKAEAESKPVLADEGATRPLPQIDLPKSEDQDSETRGGTQAEGHTSSPPQPAAGDSSTTGTCEHGVAWDVHCCGCHSGFLFDSTKCVCF